MKIFAMLLAIFAVVASVVAVKDDICALPHSEDGMNGIHCMAYMPSWSYNASTNECVDFIYGGCGGNDNRFDTKTQCEEKCKE